MYGVVWFRADLRIHDNKALYHASQKCSDGIAAIYVMDHQFLAAHDTAACRIEFILRSLQSLQADLNKLNIPLLFFEIKKTEAIIELLSSVLESLPAQALFFNRQYEIDEKRRDQRVQAYFTAKNIMCHGYDDQIILAPQSVKTQQGNNYKVFTPYRRAWIQVFIDSTPTIVPKPKKQAILTLKSNLIPPSIGIQSVVDPNLWPASEEIAIKQLSNFIDQRLFAYDKYRDFPAHPGTSQLSPYLTVGILSPRHCFLAAMQANKNQLETGNKGAVTWMSELIWREFYKSLLITYSRLSMNKPYQMRTDKLLWNYDEKLFNAWAQGETGFPIIDAAMRQLKMTGWMHNRLRMIVAMFFTKNLFLDWRLGEKYFMSHLLDGDLAANNGGWQWCASTGVDAVPYFRVFNPIRQSQRFDPHGAFIRKFCPELNALSDKDIHDPSVRVPNQLGKLNYPRAIVDLDKSRKNFIAEYKKIISMN